MYKISGKVMKFIMEVMKTWKVELIVEGKTLMEVEIRGGHAFTITIFNNDAAAQSHSEKIYRGLQIYQITRE